MLGWLQQPQQGLGDAQEVDHLSDAEQRGDDQGTAVGTLQEGRGALVPQDLPGTVQEPSVGVLVDSALQRLESGLHHVTGVDSHGSRAPSHTASQEGHVERRLLRGCRTAQLVQVGKEGEVDDGEGDVPEQCGPQSLVEASDAPAPKQVPGQLGGCGPGGGRGLHGGLGTPLGRQLGLGSQYLLLGGEAAGILKLDLQHLHGGGHNHLASASSTARQHLLKQGQLLPVLGELISKEVVGGQLDGLLRGDEGQVHGGSSVHAKVALRADGLDEAVRHAAVHALAILLVLQPGLGQVDGEHAGDPDQPGDAAIDELGWQTDLLISHLTERAQVGAGEVDGGRRMDEVEAAEGGRDRGGGAVLHFLGNFKTTTSLPEDGTQLLQDSSPRGSQRRSSGRGRCRRTDWPLGGAGPALGGRLSLSLWARLGSPQPARSAAAAAAAALAFQARLVPAPDPGG